jgi:hypothetical protein
MEERINLTVNLTPAALKSLKLEAVERDLSYSDLAADRLRRIVDTGDIGDAALLKKKHQHYGIFIGRGRPSGEFIEAHGPIIKKKATFHMDETLCRKARRFSRALGLSVSDLVELSLKAGSAPSAASRPTKAT